MYNLPPVRTSTLVIVFELITEIIGDINASGLRVLSDEYSNPGFNILTLLILLIFVESGIKLALIPCVEAYTYKCWQTFVSHSPIIYFYLIN